jgi:hypothetical protein
MVRYINGKITIRNEPIDYLCFYRPKRWILVLKVSVRENKCIGINKNSSIDSC